MDKQKSITNKGRKATKSVNPAPTIIGTKASMARAKAINAQLRSQANKSAIVRKRKREEPESSDQALKRKAQELNQKPAWDLRGRIEDIEYIYEKNMQTLEGLMKFKQEFDILKDEKETEEKRALQQVASLKARLQEMERQHQKNIVDIKAAQRVERQKMEDEEFNYLRRLQTIKAEADTLTEQLDIEQEKVRSIQKKNQELRHSVEVLEYKIQNFTEEDTQLAEELKYLDGVLEEKTRQVEERTKVLERKKRYMAEIDKKLAESNADRDRLAKKIAELEAKRKKELKLNFQRRQQQKQQQTSS